MTRRPPRRPTSASSTSRPRKIAGHGGSTGPVHDDPTADEPPVAATADTEPDPDPDPEVEDAGPVAATEPDRPEVHPTDDEDDVEDADVETDTATDTESPTSGGLAGPRATRLLVVAIVVLLVALAGTAGTWWWLRSDTPPEVRAATGQNPVQITPEESQEAAAAAADAASTIVATSYEDYDEQVDEAAALMTDSFAEEYRATAEDVRGDIVDQRTVVEVRVVGQGVVRASTTQVQVLVFLNQYVTKTDGTTYTPYRALVTVVNTDEGWLVADLDTR